MTPTPVTEVKDVPIQRTVTDLDTMDEVTLVRPFAFTPVGSTQEALTRLGNDAKQFLAIINEGLRAEERRIAGSQTGDWYIMDEDGKPTSEVFVGTIADPKAVNSTVLNMSKMVFSNKLFSVAWDKLTSDQKKSVKTAALEFIKSNPILCDGLKVSAALKPVE